MAWVDGHALDRLKKRCLECVEILLIGDCVNKVQQYPLDNPPWIRKYTPVACAYSPIRWIRFVAALYFTPVGNFNVAVWNAE